MVLVFGVGQETQLAADRFLYFTERSNGCSGIAFYRSVDELGYLRRRECHLLEFEVGGLMFDVGCAIVEDFFTIQHVANLEPPTSNLGLYPPVTNVMLFGSAAQVVLDQGIVYLGNIFDGAILE